MKKQRRQPIEADRFCDAPGGEMLTDEQIESREKEKLDAKNPTVSTTAISEAYSEKFDNYAELAHPAIFFLPKFGVLLQKAIARNSPLTRQEVEAVFGDPGWEW